MRKIKVIISPAKKMNIDNDSIIHTQLPVFLDETEKILTYLKGLTYEQLKTIWKCSDKLAQQNFERVKEMDLQTNLSPAILSFEGIQYQYMGATVFTDSQLDYLSERLRILSGFYGILKPFDGVTPYRLEMQSKFINWEYKSLYDFWDSKIAFELLHETDCIINLASKEYSKAIIKYLPKDFLVIDCIFGQCIDGKVKEKGTLAKMARGEMVRFMAENKVRNPEEIKKFNRLNFIFNEKLSNNNKYVFIQEEN